MKKYMVAVLIVLLAFSIGFNAYQCNRLSKEKQKAHDLAGFYMSNSVATFSNGLVGLTRENVNEYIAKPDNLNSMIEYIQTAQTYYEVAARCVSQFQLADASAGFFKAQWLISNGYLKELREYRQYLINNPNGAYEHIDQIATDAADLLVINEWLQKRYSSGDFPVYNDDDFYKEVYNSLKSDLKDVYFNANTT